MAMLRVIAGVVAASRARAADIYPSGHWDRVTEVNVINADNFVRSNVDAGKTVFIRWIASERCGGCATQAPAWDRVTEAFRGSDDVVFGDVDLSKHPVRMIAGREQNPGQEGWPTIRYFNKLTGYGGAGYARRTKKAVSDELGPKDGFMQKFVEEQGGTSLCDVKRAEETCTTEEKQYLWSNIRHMDDGELEKEHTRLDAMVEVYHSSGSTTGSPHDALAWLRQRMSLLRQLRKKKQAQRAESEEL